MSASYLIDRGGRRRIADRRIRVAAKHDPEQRTGWQRRNGWDRRHLRLEVLKEFERRRGGPGQENVVST